MRLTHYNACTPRALTYLFREPYEASCRRIRAAGGDYRSVTSKALQRVLEPAGIAEVQDHTRRPRDFTSWRRGRRGRWVVVATGHGACAGHCITLIDGKAHDNGWSAEWRGRIKTLRVHAAWQIKKTVAPTSQTVLI